MKVTCKISDLQKNLCSYIHYDNEEIIIPKFDLEGNISSPLRVEELYNITSVEPYRLDGNGRIEYHKLNLLSKHERSFQL